MSNKFYIYSFCLLLIAGCRLPFTLLTAQDIHFSQLSETPLLINPGLTGVYDGYLRGIMNYRNQWPSMGKPYNTMMGSFDMPLLEGKLGAGAYFYSDKAGDTKFGTTQANLSVSSIIQTQQESKLSFGLQFGFAQHSANLSTIKWPNQYNGMSYDPGIAHNEAFNASSFGYFDMGAGMNYEFETTTGTIVGKDIFRFDAGAAFFHATMPKQRHYGNSSEKLYGRIIAHSTIRYDVPGTLVGIVPSFIYMMQGPASELNIGTLIRYKINQGTKITNFSTESAFSAGVHYRLKDAIVPQIYFEMSDFGIGVSYDINVSSYTGQKSTGAFEISIKYASMRGAVRKPKI